MATKPRTYEVGKYYLIGSLLKFYEVDRSVLIAYDFSPDEAAEYAAEFGKGVRIFTGSNYKLSIESINPARLAVSWVFACDHGKQHARLRETT